MAKKRKGGGGGGVAVNTLKTRLSLPLDLLRGRFYHLALTLPPNTRSAKTTGNEKNLRNKQDLDVAIIKATSSATHVAPKEKHVATLKYAVGPQAPRAQVAYVCRELRARLRSATDWLVRYCEGREKGGRKRVGARRGALSSSFVGGSFFPPSFLSFVPLTLPFFLSPFYFSPTPPLLPLLSG